MSLDHAGPGGGASDPTHVFTPDKEGKRKAPEEEETERKTARHEAPSVVHPVY